MSWWYVSFADANGFLGGAVIEADNKFEVIPNAWLLGCNPGGEALLVEIPIDQLTPPITPDLRNRLLSREDMERLGWGPVRVPDEYLK